MIMIRAGGEVQVFAPNADRGLSVLFAEDALAIEREIPGVQMVSPVQNQRGITVVARDRSVVTRAFGVDSDWMTIRRWGVAEGEFISDADIAGASRVVLLAAKVARELFPEGGALGETVRINNDPYVVKGLFIEMGTDAGGDDWDNRVVVPYTTSTRRLFNRPSLEQIVLRVTDASRVAETAERVRALMRVRHQIGQGEGRRLLRARAGGRRERRDGNLVNALDAAAGRFPRRPGRRRPRDRQPDDGRRFAAHAGNRPATGDRRA